MFKARGITFRLVLSFLLVSTFYMFSIIYGIVSIKKLAHLQDEGAQRFKDSNTVNQVAKHVAEVYSVMADAAINQKFDETERDLKKLKETYLEDIKKLDLATGDDSEKKLVLEIKENYLKYLTVFEQEQLPELKLHKSITAQAREIDGKLDDIREKTLEPLNNFLNLLQKESEKGDIEFDAASSNAFTIGLLGGILSTILSIATAVLFAKSISKQLTMVSQTIGTLVEKLGTLVSQLVEAAKNLSEASTEQASAIQETSASMEQMSSMIAKSADSAVLSAEVARSSADMAQKGEEASARMLEAVTEISQSQARIAEQVNDSNAKIADIANIIKNIGSKTKVINEIVFQTKLLSFNASVEAARAGEHGKGFSVVAEEVGSLAQMSGNAAKEISDMLESSIKAVSETVSTSQSKINEIIKNGDSVVQQGRSVAEETGTYLHNISDGVKTVTSHSSEIATASKEQATGVQQVTSAISMLDKATQQNASLSKDLSVSAEEVDHVGEELRKAVSDLEFVVKGKRAA